MQTKNIEQIIIKLAEIYQHKFSPFELRDKHVEDIHYDADEVGTFIDHLMEKGQKINVALLKNHIAPENLEQLIRAVHFPVLVFRKLPDNAFAPIIIYNNQRNQIQGFDFCEDCVKSMKELIAIIPELITYENSPDVKLQNEIILITAFPLRYIMDDFYRKDNEVKKKVTTIQRLFRLLQGEKRMIVFIYIYAIAVGLISLSLPLGIQATIGLVSGGMVFSSVVVLIALVILGVMAGGGLQIMQISLVENLQQRIFAKTAFEFAFRIPKVKMESLLKYYPPELLNRFFDVLTLQKGLPKLFVDITGALLQIFFGLLLLSLYHPSFLVFALILVGVVVGIFYLTGPKGLRTSLKESDHKYKVAYWLQELARTVDSFKMAGHTNLPLQKMDEHVNNYLHYRKSHFKVLLLQFANIVIFKTIIIGGLLVLGTFLVVERQITLGQLVASEVIIVLIVSSVEKLIVSMDTVYDMLTAVEKIAKITDLPIERASGLHVTFNEYEGGMHLKAKDLKYKYPGNQEYTIQGIDFEFTPGESICIAGANDSGKHTLMKVITGILDDFEGILTVNHLSQRDLNLVAMRDKISKNLTQDEIFDGTILDNITLGCTDVNYKDVIWAIEKIGLADYINSLPEGLYTRIGSSGKKLSGSVTAKVILARSVVSRPKLLIINDFSEHISRKDKVKILKFLQDKSNGWTLIILSISDDPLLFESCDKIMLLSAGKVAAQGSYLSLKGNLNFQRLIFRDKLT
ncbi:xenobiotic-transporting ATPase [marine bacterium AO1-C]|nr:xenobiotic-transporting ATPase [marine bacterium AO1-C]